MIAAISVRNLTVHHGEVCALEDITVEVPQGRVTGLLGANGSGKSTLFSSIMGLVTPTRGRISLFGADPATVRRRGDVAYVPQLDAVDRDFPISVEDVVMMGRFGMLGPIRRSRQKDRDAVHAAIERVGLEGLASRSIGALSGGQRRRAFVARAIAQEARLLLLDEPFAGVDRVSERTIAALLRSLRSEGRSILVSTHNLADADELCDDAVVLNRRLLYSGPAAEAVTPDRLAMMFGAAS